MNFWEARQVALSGKKVIVAGRPDNVFSKADFEDVMGWSNADINGDWELVQEPKTVTVYYMPMSNKKTSIWHDLELAQTYNKDRFSIVEIVTDERGKLVSARNVD